jgi:hypothetical protein
MIVGRGFLLINIIRERFAPPRENIRKRYASLISRIRQRVASLSNSIHETIQHSELETLHHIWSEATLTQ